MVKVLVCEDLIERAKSVFVDVSLCQHLKWNSLLAESELKREGLQERRTWSYGYVGDMVVTVYLLCERAWFMAAPPFWDCCITSLPIPSPPLLIQHDIGALLVSFGRGHH
ncbi:uncharacterized protein LOC130745884 isoform X4 [Lotus japonicus]|uniref:uncharacterized protein LOC130745884 isoform X4 n=1 Tax=Lotus japonicus TaxID=34305 RepID=UPI00258B1AAF|nr:uncharacterized protein LOC130745884 isoform X4 [Lotus japonicus]